MGKSVPYVFLAISIAFFLFLVGLTGYRIESVRRSNAVAASENGKELLATAKALRDVSGSFDSPYFKSKMREVFSVQPRLLVLTLYTWSDGISYLIARNKSYLVEPKDASPGWRGTPSYRSSPGFETLFTLSFPLISPDGEHTVIMDSLFVVFGREDIYPILRDDLYLLLAFLIVCGIFILIAANITDNGREGYVPIVSGAGGSPARADAASYVSPESGLARADYFGPRLKTEIQRAASADEEVSVACIEIDGFIPEPFQAPCFLAVARVLFEIFPLHDLVFETGKKSYAVILPDADIDRAVKNLEELRTRLAGSPLEGRTLTVSIGVSSRGGRLIEDTTLHQEAVVSVQKALREGGNRVVGFRANTSKFRQALSGVEGQGIPS